MYLLNMLSLLFCMIVPSFGGLFDEDIVNFEKVFEREEIIERQNNPNINTIIDEFIIFFDLECLAEKKSLGRNIMGEFLTEFPCYGLNEEKYDKFPEIMDEWIVVNKLCDDDDDKEIIWNDFCLKNVEQNEEWEEYSSDLYCDGCSCSSRTVNTDLYWNLNDACPDVTDGVNILTLKSQSSDPNFDIIIMDSNGISSTHNEFIGLDIIQIYDGTNGSDITSNHATMMAGIIAGSTSGVMNKLRDSSYIKLIDVRTGTTSTSDIVSSFDAIINYLNSTNRKSIISISFGSEGSGTTSIINRIETIYNLDGYIICAAGNGNKSAYSYYPPSSRYTIAVGSHNENLERASFSNYGDFVDIYAPGVSIYGPSYTTDTKYTTASGTSFAGPFVAGVAANILASNPDFSFQDLKTKMLQYAAYDINDGLGNTDKPRVQISCDEYLYDDGLTTNSPTTTTTTTITRTGCSSDISANCYIINENSFDGTYSGSYKQFCDPLSNGYRVTLQWSISNNCTDVDDIDIDGFNIIGKVQAAYKYDPTCC